MCNPIVAGLAISAATAYAQKKQQDASAAQQEADLDAAGQRSTFETDAQQMEISENNSEQVSDRVRSAMIESSRLATAAGESGVAGNSIDRIKSEQRQGAADDIDRIKTNTSRQQTQTGRNLSNARAGYAAERNGIQRGSWLNTGLQIAGRGAKAYGDYKASQ